MRQIILSLIDNNKYGKAREYLLKKNVVDIAEFMEKVDNQKLLIIFRILPKEIASDVFSYISNELQQYIIESITDKEIKSIIDDLYFDDTMDLVEEMPSNVVNRILMNTDEERRKLINQFLNYPEDSAGSIMTIEYVDLRRQMTVKEAIQHIKEVGIDKRTIHTCYIINDNRKLEGIVSIRKLILSEENDIIEDIMESKVIHAHTIDDQEKIADLFKKYDIVTMPIVDKECRLVGIVTIDDVVDIIEQENTEDIQKMAAMEPSEDEYLKTSVFVLAKNRIVWLLVLMISAIFTGNIIRKFENVLQTVVVLASFIPMLMDTGGNAGSQSSTLIIRGLALGEIKLNDVFKVLWKEVRVGLIVGIVLSSVNFIRIYYIDQVSLNIALTVCISLFFTVILAKFAGGMLPIIAQKLKADPAIMASPLITTMVDAVALIIYFSMATALLGI